MRKLLAVLTAFALGVALTAPAQAAGPATFAEAKAMAEKENKPLLIDFYADW